MDDTSKTHYLIYYVVEGDHMYFVQKFNQTIQEQHKKYQEQRANNIGFDESGLKQEFLEKLSQSLEQKQKQMMQNILGFIINKDFDDSYIISLV